MNANAKIDAAIRQNARIALDHRVLNLDRAPYGIDNAAKFHECAIACALENAPVMYCDGGINEIASENPVAPTFDLRPRQSSD